MRRAPNAYGRLQRAYQGAVYAPSIGSSQTAVFKRRIPATAAATSTRAASAAITCRNVSRCEPAAYVTSARAYAAPPANHETTPATTIVTATATTRGTVLRT